MLHLWASWMEGVGGQNVSVGGKGGLKYSGYNEMYNIYVCIYIYDICVCVCHLENVHIYST